MNLQFEEHLSPSYAEDVRRILYDADEEFVPTLSSRAGTTQTKLKDINTSTATPSDYFENMRKQAFILAFSDEKLVGFLSYIPHHKLLIAGQDWICSYVSTIVVDKHFRGHKATEAMYHKLYEVTKDSCVATRTWSRNHAHIHILEKEQFQLFDTITDDRGPGVDTVYYAKELK